MLKVLILNIFLIFHPVHVTLTSIDQAQGSDTLKVFFRMYYDDFLRDYKLFDQDFKGVGISDNNPVTDGQIIKYFNYRVRIYINNKLLIGRLAALSNDNIEITLKLLYKSEAKPVKFRIQHKVLTGLYYDQANMVYLNINNYQDALKLTPGHLTEKRILSKE